MKHNKKTVVYARTSSKKQKIDLQLEAAKPLLTGIQPEDVIVITDEGVRSSTQGKGFQKLLDLIQADKVDTLIVFDRNRLTRNKGKYMDLVNLINSHQVKVTFTAGTGHPYDPEIEGILAHMLEIERINISNRIKAALKAKHA